MGNYNIKSITVNKPRLTDFYDYLDYKFRGSYYGDNRGGVLTTDTETGKIWYNVCDIFVPGVTEVFLGPQNDPQFGKPDYHYGIYKVIGSIKSKPGGFDWVHDSIVLEDRQGRRAIVKNGATIITKERLQRDQEEYGFEYPEYLKEQWPDLVENPKNMPKEYELVNSQLLTKRTYIDMGILLIIWLLVYSQIAYTVFGALVWLPMMLLTVIIPCLIARTGWYVRDKDA